MSTAARADAPGLSRTVCLGPIPWTFPVSLLIGPFCGCAVDRDLRCRIDAIPNLPVSEYPEVVPPSVVVRTVHPGANPKGDPLNRSHAAGRGDQWCRRHDVFQVGGWL